MLLLFQHCKKIQQAQLFFYIEGGPGVAASKNASFFADKEIPYRKYHDIVLIDIRGTGKSNPLNCNSLQYTAGLQEQFDEMYPVQAVKECYDSLSMIADLSQYTTSIIAEDMDEVRQWLGYKKIHLFGLSYGTKLAQEYMRRFPDAVQSVVLFSPVIMNSKMPLPFARFAQNALDSLFADCGKDSVCNYSFPNLSYEFNFLKEKGRRVPFEVDHIMSDGTKKKITISWDAFQTKIRTLLYLPFTQRNVPYIIHETYNGNWKPFIGLYKEKESFSDFIAEGLYLCITCSEDIPFIKDEEITPATANTFMNTYRVDQQKRACSLWSKGTIPSGYLEPVNSTIQF
jgi:pimeloyl-ACP methyl ester carboxylesterase